MLDGSGKFETPCERMQRAYLRPCVALLADVELVDDLPCDPQAAIPSAQAIAAPRIRVRDISRLYSAGDYTSPTSGLTPVGPLSCATSAAGISIVMDSPPPSRERAATLPPWMAAIDRTIASPSP